MSKISESENIATMTVNHYERILSELAEARELLAKALVRGDLALSETKKAKEELFWSDCQDKREMQRELAEVREQNAKLRDIAERAIDDLRWFYEGKSDSIVNELDRLKEGAE
jgi:hypothetical protein